MTNRHDDGSIYDSLAQTARAYKRWENYEIRLGVCACGTAMLSETPWRSIPKDKRPVGWNRHGGKGECNRCAKARLRARGPMYGTRAEQRSREEVLEDWELLRSDGVTDLAVAAERMGMTLSGLQQALYRARKAGDERGVVHRNDDLGGLDRKSTTGYNSRRASIARL